MSDSSILRQALNYARGGWAVLPVKPRGKEPLSRHGVHDATRDETTIHAWWTQWPEANIAIATGRLSNLVVVDIDGTPGELSLRRLVAEFGGLGKTLVAKTGRGRHFYFFCGAELRSRRLAPGIDLRGDGGYVVAPPSVHPGGLRYTWCSPCLPLAALPAAWLSKLKASRPVARRPDREKIPEGARNETLASLAGTMRRRGMSLAGIQAGLLAENNARCDPPLDEPEVCMIAASIARYEPGAAAEEKSELGDPWSHAEENTQRERITHRSARFVQLRDEFLRETNLSMDARGLAAIIVMFANGELLAWPGTKALMRLTGWGRHRVEAARAELTGGRIKARREQAWMPALYVRRGRARFEGVRYDLSRIVPEPFPQKRGKRSRDRFLPARESRLEGQRTISNTLPGAGSVEVHLTEIDPYQGLHLRPSERAAISVAGRNDLPRQATVQVRVEEEL